MAIAEATGISGGYIEQLLIPLRKAGIVRGIRGPQGGHLPAKPPDQITVGQILRIAEGNLEGVECVSGDHSKTCPMSAGCKSRNIWVELYLGIKRCVDSISLADLAKACNKAEQVEYTI